MRFCRDRIQAKWRRSRSFFSRASNGLFADRVWPRRMVRPGRYGQDGEKRLWSVDGADMCATAAIVRMCPMSRAVSCRKARTAKMQSSEHSTKATTRSTVDATRAADGRLESVVECRGNRIGQDGGRVVLLGDTCEPLVEAIQGR